jgi:hypothetical protein
MVSLRIPASSASGFYCLGLLLLLRELKRWNIIATKVVNRGDSKAGKE